MGSGCGGFNCDSGAIVTQGNMVAFTLVVATVMALFYKTWFLPHTKHKPMMVYGMVPYNGRGVFAVSSVLVADTPKIVAWAPFFSSHYC
eukprot:scaffold23039_cov84-Amphora_coffeaeformis.AAC.1